eukprot:728670_1
MAPCIWICYCCLLLIVYSQTVHDVTLQFVSQDVPYSVLNHTNPQLPAKNRGIETGLVLKIDDVYHLFATELLYPPCVEDGLFWCTTAIAHWESIDQLHWKRLATLAQGHGRCNQTDNNAVYWSPLISQRNNAYYLTYIGYDIICADYPTNGSVWLADPVSNVYNLDANPSNWSNTKIEIMNQSNRQPWEGVKDVVDSFANIYPGNTNNDTIYSFYGSCCNPDQMVGIAYSATGSMNGPWIRYANNPINFTLGTENPIITKTIRDNITYFLAVYCVNAAELKGLGFSWSLDGLRWSNTKVIAPAQPIPYARVPLGLIEEKDGDFTLFYTDFDQRHAGKTQDWEGYEGMYVSKMKLTITAVPHLKPDFFPSVKTDSRR